MARKHKKQGPRRHWMPLYEFLNQPNPTQPSVASAEITDDTPQNPLPIFPESPNAFDNLGLIESEAFFDPATESSPEMARQDATSFAFSSTDSPFRPRDLITPPNTPTNVMPQSPVFSFFLRASKKWSEQATAEAAHKAEEARKRAVAYRKAHGIKPSLFKPAEETKPVETTQIVEKTPATENAEETQKAGFLRILGF